MLFYDVETTGLPDFSLPARAHERQPGVAQLAAVMVDENRRIRGAIDLIFRQPDTVIVTEGATKIHGIGREQMGAYGVSPQLAVRAFIEMLDRCTKLCAHNQKFDQKMMRIEMHRNSYGYWAEKLRDFPVDCTMELSDAIMKMAPTERMIAAGFTKSKPPKLEEAYKHFTGNDMRNAHNAWADVMATIEIHTIIAQQMGRAASREENGGVRSGHGEPGGSGEIS